MYHPMSLEGHSRPDIVFVLDGKHSSAVLSLAVSFFFREVAFGGFGENDDTQTAPHKVGFGSDRECRLPVLVTVEGGDMGYSCTFSH